jgi:ABC-type antimicrobial peptide transport system permease subunit
MRARADIRARPLSLILVTLLVGVIGGIGITALAASRRTDSAYRRYRVVDNEPDAIVLSCPSGAFFLPRVDLPRVRALPAITSSAAVSFVTVDALDGQGNRLLSQDEFSTSVIGLRRSQDADVVRARLLSGRMPTGPDEVALGYMPDASNVPKVGDRIQLVGPTTPDGSSTVKIPVTVVGQVLIPGELTGDQTNLWASEALAARLSRVATACDALAVHLRNGLSDSATFLASVYRITPDAFVLDLTNEALFVSRTVHLNALILRLLAVLAAIAGIMILGQSLVRRASLGALDDPILRSIGMTRRQILWGATLPGVIVAVGGSTIAVLIALAASSSFPTGLARVAEPTTGVHVDVFAVGLGVAVICVTTLLSVAIPSWWLARSHGGVGGSVEYGGAERPSKVASAFARLPLPPSAGAGARLALEPGHGRSATPVRSAAIGLTLAVAAMVAAFGFAASMDHFGRTPRLAGIDFDFGAGQPFGGDAFEKQALPVIVKDPGIADVAAGNFQHYVLVTGPGGSSQESAWGLETVKGSTVTTTMLEGRWPTAPDEVALGRETMAATGSDVGDVVDVTAASTTRPMRVVGVTVFSDNGFGPGLGHGVAMTFDSLGTLFPGVTRNLVFARLAPGVSRDEVATRLDDEVLNDMNASVGTGLQEAGPAVTATLRSRTLPLRLSVLFALAAFATLVHVLITSVRRRRRDLAILQTLGFKRRQVAATVAWQALVLSGIALLFGVPLGILLGRLGWAAFAYRLGVVSEPVVSPFAWIVVPVTLIVAVVVALGPGIAARRVRPAQVLRAE